MSGRKVESENLLRDAFGTKPAVASVSLLDRLDEDHQLFERRLAAHLDPYQRCVTTPIGPHVAGHSAMADRSRGSILPPRTISR